MVELPGVWGNTDVSPALQSPIQALSLNQLEALGETLLDFSEPIEFGEPSNCSAMLTKLLGSV
ncbi:MAG: DUF4351 domain-containing protein [Acaryochloris sp. RU_4_1]|nr:DUF4351 domain-containing protein [Acaryochloris sp. RU_4_1]NJR56660.1 DUF4351 domain-containing protein [Acaryochloris sp. CRU_2_0]